MKQAEPALYQLESPHGLDALIRELIHRGYDVIGPTVRDRSVVLARISGTKDLPLGYSDAQEKGIYRLAKNVGAKGYFGYNLGPTSWKSYLFPERRRLWTLKRNSNPESSLEEHRPFAFLGVRACELAAIKVQDGIFLRGPGDPDYRQRRENVFVVGVHCRTAAATCFCPSMGTGPEFSAAGWDLLLTEDCNGDSSRFFIQSGTPKGQSVLAALPTKEAPHDARDIASDQLAKTKEAIVRAMDQKNIKEEIFQSITSHNWEDVGARCLACANCTLVCPTCFCSTVEDVSDLEEATAERWQKWDSCFHVDFSYTHGGSRRLTTGSRYRQWFTHKLATWHDQFGSSGCVGCGRCIAWCPVGIDITEEMTNIRQKSATKEVKDG